MTADLTLITRIGCHLCEDMRTQLQPYLAEAGVRLTQLFIDGDSELEQLYGTLVPVLKADDREICHYFLDLKALQQYMSEVGNPLK